VDKRLNVVHADIEKGLALRWKAWGIGTSSGFRDPEGSLCDARNYPVHNDSEK